MTICLFRTVLNQVYKTI